MTEIFETLKFNRDHLEKLAPTKQSNVQRHGSSCKYVEMEADQGTKLDGDDHQNRRARLEDSEPDSG